MVERPLDELRDEVREQHLTLYDHFDPLKRRRVPHWERHPILGDDGHEIRLYDQDGHRFNRILAIRGSDRQTGGVLVKLNTIQSLFLDSISSDKTEDEPSPRRSTGVMVYPHAFFTSLGHVKASCVISVFQTVVDSVNSSVASLQPTSRQAHHCPAIQPVCSQFYNEVSHRLAKRAGAQEVQKGIMTGVMASNYPGLDHASKEKGARIFDACHNGGLPFVQHFKLLEPNASETNVRKDLRCENVFILDMNAFPPDKRDGR